METKKYSESKSLLIGSALVVLAFLSAATMNALAKVAITTIPLSSILFMQNFFALLIFTPFVLIGRKKNLETKKIKLHLLRAITGLLSFACLFFSMKSISLVDATLLGNAAPLFLPFVFWAWMGKKVSGYVWGSILIGYLGVFLILNPTHDFVRSWMALLALAASLFSAIALQCVRNLTQTESSLKIVFYYFLIASVITLPFFVVNNRCYSSHEWLNLACIGICLGITQLLLAKAYIYADPTVVGPFNYSVVVFAGLIQWWFWDMVPSRMHFIGIFLVCLGGIITILQQRRKGKTHQ